jgi:hypothetical protein
MSKHNNKRILKKAKRHKNYHYRIISMLVGSSNVFYIKSIPFVFRGRHKAIDDFMNIIEDWQISYDDVVSAFAHNRIIHKRMELKLFYPEHIYLGEEANLDIYEKRYFKFRQTINKANKMKSFKLK